MKVRRDFSLYLVTDRRLIGERSLASVVAAALRGGVTAVQLREKGRTTRAFLEVARGLKSLLRPAGVPLIINDRVDVALAVEADGVHVGQSDMPAAVCRRLMGRGAIVGLSVESLEDAEAAEAMDVDYLGVSPVYATPTKAELTRGLGLSGLRAIRAASRHLLVGIGGLKADNTAAVIRAGADGVAVVSAICASPDPEAAARALSAAIREGRAG